MTLDNQFRTRLSRYVPADLLDKLPDVDTLTEVIRRLNGLEKAIASFLPLYVADDDTMLTQDIGLLRPGTFLFADVSGFTALSEKLQHYGGSEGAETLTLVINDYFATMLEILAKSDGQLLKFAGDALLAFFPAANDDDALKAIRTGLRMQRAMSKFQPIQTPELKQLLGDHDQQLSMSIGLSQGKLFEAVVGSRQQRDHLIQGSLPGMAMNAEGAGDRDDVIIDAALAASQAANFTTTPVEDGFFRVVDNFGDRLDDYEFHIPNRRRAKVSAIFDFDPGNLMDSLKAQLERVEKVGRFMAPAVLNELVIAGDHLQSQNRLVITMFMHVSGFATLLEMWGEERLPLLTSILDRYYKIVQQTISSHGGTLTRSDPYQSGIKMLITFGAPVANPDDAQRAVAAALELHRQIALFNARLMSEVPPELQCPAFVLQRMGITLGPVFAGEVGWRARREYTVMGDDVNLAARLMSKADIGRVLISERVWERVNQLFETEKKEPLTLKGKSKPVQTYQVKGTLIASVGLPTTSETPFVGQDLLMRTLKFDLSKAKDLSRRRAVALFGDAGIGKTRIAKELTQLAVHDSFAAAWATCALKSERKTTWSSLICQLLRLNRTQGDEAQRKELRERLQQLDLLKLEGVFGDLLFDAVLPAEAAPAAPHEEKPAAPSGSDIFKLASRLADPMEKTSGLFGRARDHLQMSEADQNESSLFQQVEIRTDLSEVIVRFLRVFTHSQPTIIVIDDVHRENPQALQILKRLLAENEPMRLLLLFTYEPVELDIEAQSLFVGDLTEDETYVMIAAVLNVKTVGSRLREFVWKRTNGRPLFIESLLQTLLDQQNLELTKESVELKQSADIAALPDDVRKLVISRVDRLAPQAQAVLRAGAVIGDSFSFEALMSIAAIDSADEMRASLHELSKAQLVEEQGEGIYHFRHGMTQRAIYESLPRILRQKLHRSVAEYLTRQADWERHPLIVAHHWGSGGMPTRAIQIVSDAAEKAELNQEVDYAIELYTSAIELFPLEKSWQTQLERLQNLPKSSD
jgi:class 3 adenylate cyclase